METETEIKDKQAIAADMVLEAGSFKPILFSTPMVQAILRGSKTQTRRLVKPQPSKQLFDVNMGYWSEEPENLKQPYFKAKYNVGDIMWVRETFHPKRHSLPTGLPFEYKATAEEDGNPTDEVWKPSIFMPKEACRIFLKVTNIRVERLENITEEDAISEGILCCKKENRTGLAFFDYSGKTTPVSFNFDSPIDSFKTLWQSINGVESWKDNPWVFVYEFERTEASFACR